MIHPVICHNKIVVIAQDWPCWLAPALAMKLPLAAVFVTKAMQSLFSAWDYIPLSRIDALWEVPSDWSTYTVLASGTHKRFSFILTKLSLHVGPLIYATDVVFRGRRPRDVMQLLGAWTNLHARQGFILRLVHHSDFGVITSGVHLLSCRGWTLMLSTHHLHSHASSLTL
jgi:hypothetical protein